MPAGEPENSLQRVLSTKNVSFHFFEIVSVMKRFTMVPSPLKFTDNWVEPEKWA